MNPIPGSADLTAPGVGTVVVRRTLHGVVQQVLQRRAGVCRVLDVGGGSGVWAVPLAQLGCQVTVVDPSPDALASLARRAREAAVSESVHGVQGDADSVAEVIGAGDADVVLAHGVLEVVEDVHATLVALSAVLAPAGSLSVVVAGRAASVLHRAMAGRLLDAHHVLTDPDGRVGVHDPLLRRFDTAGLESALRAAGLHVQVLQGDAVVSDLLPAPVLESVPGSAGDLAQFEAAAAGTAALREIASRLHAIATASGQQGEQAG